jgi:hypothetical protein
MTGTPDGLGMAGAGGLLGWPTNSVAAERPPETKKELKGWASVGKASCLRFSAGSSKKD